mmetsp:Transcript_26074/g.82477  ORF Transcript_26074/g.82477 Transcript_26074/m.82477 type:complete len:368 (-) Transcript_26074:2-1105(-)
MAATLCTPKRMSMDQKSVTWEAATDFTMRLRQSRKCVAALRTFRQRMSLMRRKSLRTAGPATEPPFPSSRTVRTQTKRSSRFQPEQKKFWRKAARRRTASTQKAAVKKVCRPPKALSKSPGTQVLPGKPSWQPVCMPSNCALAAMVMVLARMRAPATHSKASLRTSLRNRALHVAARAGSAAARSAISEAVPAAGSSSPSGPGVRAAKIFALIAPTRPGRSPSDSSAAREGSLLASLPGRASSACDLRPAAPGALPRSTLRCSSFCMSRSCRSCCWSTCCVSWICSSCCCSSRVRISSSCRRRAANCECIGRLSSSGPARPSASSPAAGWASFAPKDLRWCTCISAHAPAGRGGPALKGRAGHSEPP